MKIQILSIYEKTIFEHECEINSIKIAVEEAVRKEINLVGANLGWANLGWANLRGANLGGANLGGANLGGANLRGANLVEANLGGANLVEANLVGANLGGANLRGANLVEANLIEANLGGANLVEANLIEADLVGANLGGAKLPHFSIIPEGDVIGWKKLFDGTICKLMISSNVKRTSSLIGRKCRAESALVLEGEGISLTKQFKYINYIKGKKVLPDSYDSDIRVECSHGIHFFITKSEAEQFNM